MKFTLVFILTLSTFNATAGILKLSFAEQFEPQKVVMDQTLILDLMRPESVFDLDEVMLAMKKETPQKKHGVMAYAENFRGSEPPPDFNC